MIKKAILVLFMLIASALVYAAPQISNAAITNTLPILTNDNVVCSFGLNSTLGETVWANVTWYKNSAAQSTVQKGPVTSAQTLTDTLLNSATAKGETWYCSVIGYNSTESTAAVTSPTVVISNTNVTLSDIPAQTYIRSSGTKSVTLTSYAVDPDSDTITFSATSVDAAKVVCGISGQSLTISSSGNFTGVGYCDVTAYDGSYITPAKRMTVNVRDKQTLLSLPSSVYIGSSSNQARNASVSGSFPVSNSGVTGDSSISNVEISTNAASGYNVTFSLDNSNFQPAVSGFSLNPGDSKTIYFKGFVPVDMASGNVDIGDITVKSTETTQAISQFYINTESMLKIYEINVDVDGNSDGSISISGDDIDEKAKPGSVVKLEIKLKNDYSDSSEIDLEDVKITGEIVDMDTNDDSDNEDDNSFDEETDTFKVKYDSKSDWKYLTFNVPYDVEEGNYDIVITAEGSDEKYGSEHTASTTLVLEVERKDHLIKIMEAKLGSDEIRCDEYTTLDMNLQNIGGDNEDEVSLKVKNSDLGLAYTSDLFEMSEDPDDDENEYSKVLTIDLRGKGIKSGVYPIEVSTFYSEDIISDKKTVNLNVRCDEPKSETKEETDETVDLENDVKETEGTGEGAVAEEVSGTETVESSSFLGESSYFTLLVLANIIVVIVVVFLIFKFLIAPKN